jgi:hypothetical protein
MSLSLSTQAASRGKARSTWNNWFQALGQEITEFATGTGLTCLPCSQRTDPCSQLCSALWKPEASRTNMSQQQSIQTLLPVAPFMEATCGNSPRVMSPGWASFGEFTSDLSKHRVSSQL